MAKPLYERTKAKPLRLETPGSPKARRIGTGRKSRWGVAVAASLAAAAMAGAAAWAVRPEKAAVPGPLAASLSVEPARKQQAARAPAEEPARPRTEPVAPPSPLRGNVAAFAADPPPSDAPPVAAGPALMASVEPLPAEPPAPPPSSGSAPKSAVATTAAAPLDCVPKELRTVLDEVAARFGAVSVVSTNRLNSDNHTAGTIRHKLHASCKAVDFRTSGNVAGVLAFLRSRPEVAGINSYRGGLIHIDLNESSRAAVLRPGMRPAVDE